MTPTPGSNTPAEVEQLAIEYKTCRVCFISKSIDDFVKNKIFKSGIDTICLNCSRAKVKQWRKDNPDKRKAQLQRESKKDYNHNKHLKHAYGISRDVYLQMFSKQNGCCAICNRHQLEFTRRLSVDHCHATNKIRGLLCNDCNSLLGNVRDQSELLASAINYLRKNNGT